VGRLVAWASTRLPSGSDAHWIVEHAAGIPSGGLLTVLDGPVTKATVDAVHDMVGRRTAGEPLQYILGTWSFRRLEVRVDPRALIPRPETEMVVEVALDELRRLSAVSRHGAADTLLAVDLGTGSGVIALSLALEGVGTGVGVPRTPGAPPAPAPAVEVWATDSSLPALELARTNLSMLAGCRPAAAARVRLAEGSWFGALPGHLAGRVRLVVSNPPYVSAREWTDLDPEIRHHEPYAALVPGETGLEALEILVTDALAWLAPGASLVLELAPHQAATMMARALNAGYFDVHVRPDLTGRARVLVARVPND
jgi:release factor glutamine methyltransferase